MADEGGLSLGDLGWAVPPPASLPVASVNSNYGRIPGDKLGASLSEALAALEADASARSWMPGATPPPTDGGIHGARRRPRTDWTRAG
jgi:hypothetical protein